MMARGTIIMHIEATPNEIIIMNRLIHMYLLYGESLDGREMYLRMQHFLRRYQFRLVETLPTMPLAPIRDKNDKKR